MDKEKTVKTSYISPKALDSLGNNLDGIFDLFYKTQGTKVKLLGVIMLFILKLLLRLIIRRYKNITRTEMKGYTGINSKNYKKLRTLYTNLELLNLDVFILRLRTFEDRLSKINTLSKTHNTLVKSIIYDLLRFAGYLHELKNTLGKDIKSLDGDMPSRKLPDGMRFISEQELWDRRNKAYDYII